jgi:TonB-dependent receptor
MFLMKEFAKLLSCTATLAIVVAAESAHAQSSAHIPPQDAPSAGGTGDRPFAAVTAASGADASLFHIASAQTVQDSAGSEAGTQTNSNQSDGQPAAADADESGEIVVTGIRASLRSALQTKRRTEIISDNISSDEIGQLPDVTIAEELNRLPGVNTTRDRGNASQAAVRGLGPRFVFGLVNGREVTSSEPSQELRWEVYPSEILSGVQVYKAQDSAIVPGGIAATIDIRTMRPLEYKGPTFSVRFGPTYNENGADLPNYSPWGYRGSVGLVHHLTNDIAFAIAGSIQKSKNGFPDFRTWGFNTPDNTGGHTGDLDGDGSPDNTTWGLNTEVKNIVQDRYGLVANLGWRLTDNLTLNLDSLYSKYTINEDQFQSWFGNNILGNWDNSNAGIYNAPGANYEIVNGTVVAAHLPNSGPNYQSEIADYHEAHDLFVAGANLAYETGPWNLTLDLSHSRANRENAWKAIYLSTQTGTTLDYDLRGEPSATITGGDPWDPAIQTVDPTRRGNYGGPQFTKDRIYAGAIDATYSFDSPVLKSLQFGARLANRVKSWRNFTFEMCPGVGSVLTGTDCATVPGSRTIDLSDLVGVYDIDAFTAPPMVIGNWDAIWNRVYPNDDVPAGSEQMLANSRVRMKTAEGYAKLSFGTDLGAVPLSGSVGVRVSQVRTKSTGFQQIGGTGPYLPALARNKYTDILPSINLTASLTEDQLLRFGAAISVARPPLDALTTGFGLSVVEPNRQPTGSGGNPLLKPFKAHQFDISYENYFHEESLFALAAYYKDVKRYIGTGQELQNINGIDYLISTLTNSKGGRVYGLEATFQTRFYFLPGILQNFGIYSNYTHARSNIRELAPASNPYRIVGVAKHTAQFDGFYSKGPFEARLSMKYHSPFTVAPTWVATALKELDSETLIDASLSYQVTEQLGLRFQARNLTNERGRFTSDNNRQNLSNDGGWQVYGRSYLLDVSLKF